MTSPAGNPNSNPNPHLFRPPSAAIGGAAAVPFLYQNPSPNPGARLMALLNHPSHVAGESPVPAPALSPARSPSSKIPRGRTLGVGERAVFDVDLRLAGEPQSPQLEVTPITKYVSDPGLVLGRQIAVNRTYIVYGLKLGTIRVLNSNTALRALLKGHTQRVTDMAFFAEDVHLLASVSVDARIFVWKIDEGPDEENKPQITGRVVTALHIVGDSESYHPRICWHSHKQEILFVGIGNCVLRIDITRIGRGKEFSAEEPLKCPLDKLIEGVQLIGKHDGEVTDLSISQWMLTRLASASKDGKVIIWDERKASPLVTLRPHDGEPVNTVQFMTSPYQPDHINLITAGPLNREVKIWTSASEEGWFLPSESESWQCTQILDLRSSFEPRIEEAFFNQVVVLPQAHLIVIANAKKNAIYAVHVDYGSNPASTRMDYIADFAVAMPILSLVGTTYTLPDGEQVVQVYCVQTQAIQQYALDLTQCLPAPTTNAGSGKLPLSRVLETSSSEISSVVDPIRGLNSNDTNLASPSSPLQLAGSGIERALATSYPATPSLANITSMNDFPTTKVEAMPGMPKLTTANLDALASSSVPASPAGKVPTQTSSQLVYGEVASLGKVAQSGIVLSSDSTVVMTNAPDFSINDTTRKDEPKTGQNPRLITPFEILSGVLSSPESKYARQDLMGDKINTDNMIIEKENVGVEVKVASETKPSQQEFDSSKVTENILSEEKERLSRFSDTNSGVLNARTTMIGSSNTETPQGTVIATREFIEQPSSTIDDECQDTAKDSPQKITGSAFLEMSNPTSSAKGRKQKTKQDQTSRPLSPSSSPFNSTDSLNVPGSSFCAPSTETFLPQVLAMQDTLNQLVNMQKEMEKQMAAVVAGPVTKEGKRVETALGRSLEKAIKASTDALLVRFQEENAKREKVEREHWQQITSLITNSVNKELPAMIEKTFKKEISTIGPIVARSISPVVSSAIAESFQRGVSDKAVNQLEKSVSSKLEATVAKQIQTSFQTSGKQALQDVLKSSLESSVIPAFDQSCKAMFEQIDSAFQKGISEHTATAQQQLEAAHTPLALTLRDAIHSASSITQNFNNELIDGQRKLLALVSAGGINTLNPIAMQKTNGLVGGLPEIQVEAPLDPTKELTRTISEHKYEEAFTKALQRSDVSLVSWLCSQVDVRAICSASPLPLSQGVLLALLQQLACDISNDTSKKVGWMTDVAVAINPTDTMIAAHVRPIFEQVYSILGHQRSLPTTTPAEAANIRLIMHVINSVIMSCK